MQKYSRLESTEEKRNFRNAITLVGLTILVIILLFVYGIPAVGKIASFVSGLRGSTTAITNNDKTPPAPPNLDILNDFTNQPVTGISGTAEPGATVRLTFNGADQETVVDKDGNFAFKGLTLKDGQNTFSALTQDNSGNKSQATETHTITFDNKPPDLTVTSPTDGTKFFGSTQRQVNIQGSTEASASVTINDRIVSLTNSGNFQYPVTLNAGDNKFAVKSVDQAGNFTEKEINLNFSE